MRIGRLPLVALVILTAYLVLTGCSSTNSQTSFSSRTGAYTADTKLAQAADSISKSLAELAEIERASHPQKKMPSPVDPSMIGMDQIASIDWSGPIEPLMKKIATSSKYRLNILGTPPGIPILVSITAKDIPLADVLRDANFQCGNKANIVVYPGTKVIELRYAKS